MVAALALIPAPRAGVVATLEPVLAALFAWVLVGEALAALQVFGIVLVVAAVVWVQLHRSDLEAEAAPGRA
jgi:DME family drug/metabolite transporter